MSEWKPISSAPHDRRILGMHKDHGYVVVVYHKEGCWTDGAFPMIDVTHWAPIPPPPEGDKQL